MAAVLFGRQRRIAVDKVEPGMRLCEPIRGYQMRILVHDGEVLTKLHVDTIKHWCEREGRGNLKLYTREVWVQSTTKSARLRPQCEEDPSLGVSINRYYKSKTGPVRAARTPNNPTGDPLRKRVMSIGSDGKLVRHE